MKNRIYVAGSMTGEPFYGFPVFDFFAGRLRARGWYVINPADMDREIDGFDPHDLGPDHDWSHEPLCINRDEVMQRDLIAIDSCHAIFMIPGWESSVGANIEIDHARITQKDVYFGDDGIPSPGE